MKYCIEFTDDFKYLKEVGELKIAIKEHTTTSPRDFIENFSDKTIIIAIEKMKEELFEDLAAIKKDFPDTKLVIGLADEDVDYIPKLSDLGFTYLLNRFVTNWDSLHYAISLGVSDVYLAGEICFEIDKAAALLHDKGISVRVFPNIAQAHAEIENIKKFFIRPEDFIQYEKYVDVYEFVDQPGLDVIYRVYAIDKHWIGYLGEIILNFSTELNNQCIVPEFGEVRTRCGKKCFKGRKCSICELTIKTSKLLEELEIAIKPPTEVNNA